jgi:hypothetical protein
VGDAGRLRPHRSDSDEEAQLTPLGKRASWSGNQLTHTVISTMKQNCHYIINFKLILGISTKVIEE